MRPRVVRSPLLIATLLTAVWTSGGWCQSAIQPTEVLFYSGDLKAAVQGLTIGGWGSGSCAETEEYKYEGRKSLKINTKGFYEGARFDLGNPMDITNVFQNGYLILVFRFSEKKAQAGLGPEGSGERRGFALGVSDYALGRPGYGEVPAEFGKEKTVQKTSLAEFRVVLCFEQGIMDAGGVAIRREQQDKEAWSTQAIPLNWFVSNQTLQEKKLKRILLFGDAEDTFYLAQLRLQVDKEPLKVSAGNIRELDAKVGEKLTFSYKVSAGASTVRVVWEFGDDSKPRLVSKGDVEHAFSAPGNYRVTVTATDIDGLKRPASDSILVKVRE